MGLPWAHLSTSTAFGVDQTNLRKTGWPKVSVGAGRQPIGHRPFPQTFRRGPQRVAPPRPAQLFPSILCRRCRELERHATLADGCREQSRRRPWRNDPARRAVAPCLSGGIMKAALRVAFPAASGRVVSDETRLARSTNGARLHARGAIGRDRDPVGADDALAAGHSGGARVEPAELVLEQSQADRLGAAPVS